MARRRIEVEIIGNPRSLHAALGSSVRGLDSFAARMRTIGTQMHHTGRTLTRGITLPVAGLAAASVKMGLDFEGAMTNIRALVGASAKQMEGYREGVLELARTTPQGPQALAEALYFVTSAGFEGASALRVLRASAMASGAGLGDLSQVADVVTSAVNVYGERTLKAATATDVLLATVREGKAEPAELASALGRVIAPAEAVGVSFHEVGGAVAGLTLGGLSAAEAVVGLRGTLMTLLKPSEKAKDVLADAGMNMAGIRKQVDRAGLLPTLQMLRDRFGGNAEALGALFPNVRALNAFLSLTGRNAKKNAQVMKDVAKATGDTGRAFRTAGEDPAIRMQKAWSKLRVALIELSTTLIPIVTQIVDAFSRLLDWFQGLDSSTRRMIIGFALVAAAVGPILIALGSLIVLIGVIASPIGVLVLALAGLGLALVALWTKSETFRRIVGEAWVWIQAQAARFVAWFQGTAMPAIDNVVRFLRALWARFGASFVSIARAMVVGVMGVIRPWLNVLRSVVEFFLAVLRGDWSAAWNSLKGIVRNLFATVVGIVRGYIGIVKAAVMAIGRGIAGLAGQFLSWGKSLGAAIIDGIVAAISGAGGAISGAITNALPDPGGGVPFVPGIQTGVRNFAGGLALVGERGPELVNLPRGSDVYNARQTRSMVGSPTGFEGLRIAGTLDLATGSLDGMIIGHLDAASRTARRRRRMGAA